MAEKEREIRAYLYRHVFDPVLSSSDASEYLRQGVLDTICRLSEMDAEDIVRYIQWLTNNGSETSGSFAQLMRAEGFTRFEDIRQDFDLRFSQRWLRS